MIIDNTTEEIEAIVNYSDFYKKGDCNFEETALEKRISKLRKGGCCPKEKGFWGLFWEGINPPHRSTDFELVDMLFRKYRDKNNDDDNDDE